MSSNSTLKEITEAAALLFNKTMNNYSLKDLTRHKYISYKNLYEICSQYPSLGKNFKVWRKTWPKNCYYIIKDIKFKDARHGKAYGSLYWEGKLQKEIPERIRNGLKRGTWDYDVQDSQIELDNGEFYTSSLMRSYKPKKN